MQNVEMIGLFWSLVSSVVETARRRKLAAFLADFLAHVNNDGLMLVCRHIAFVLLVRPCRCPSEFPVPFRSIPSPLAAAGLLRFSSDPQLTVGDNNRSVLYRNERSEVTCEKADVGSLSFHAGRTDLLKGLGLSAFETVAVALREGQCGTAVPVG